jgi:NAD+ kinase
VINGNGKIILCPNAERDIDYSVTRKVAEMLINQNKEVVICPLFAKESSNNSGIEKYEISRLEDELTSAEMIITFGGDGTILRAARVAAKQEVPILGVNLGGKGFLTEIEDIEDISAMLSQEYRIERRMMLDIVVKRDGKVIRNDFSLNDVVIKGDKKVIYLTLYGDEQKITNFSGDGAVIATPTGSTAYSMSAGGPIVEPSAHNIIVTPICAHVLAAKSFVLVPDRHVAVEIGVGKRNPAYMFVDGGEHVNLLSGDIIDVTKSDVYTLLICLSKGSFYQKVNEKLGTK